MLWYVFKAGNIYGKWQHIKLRGTKKHPPWSADFNDMWFISVKLVVLANTTDNQKPTTEILYLGIMCVVDFGCGDAFDTT